jgi:hypothetical protein
LPHELPELPVRHAPPDALPPEEPLDEASLAEPASGPAHDGPHAPSPSPSSPLSLLPVLLPMELSSLIASALLPLLPTSDDDPPRPVDRSSPARSPSATPASSPEGAKLPLPPSAQAQRVTTPASTAAPIRMPLDASNGPIDHSNGRARHFSR